MGQIKNIKLHIVTDIKQHNTTTTIYNNNNNSTTDRGAMGSRDGTNPPNLNEPRKTRQSKTRSPQSKLLSAAWPKAPTVPTRRSQIKAVDHGSFKKSWDEWRQKTST